MEKLSFKKLWDAYPDDPPCKDTFTNQCAIKVGAALARNGIDTTRLVDAKRHCWFHQHGEGHVLAAEELAAGLKKARLPGLQTAIVTSGEEFKSRVAGKKGIIFFKDYWLRSNDRPEQPTGDHIDLWNGSRITDWTSWLRIQGGIVIPGIWSDLEKASTVLFWQVAE